VGGAPALEDLVELGAPLFLIPLTVVAIAAIVGTAWYLTRQSAIEVDGRNVRTTAVAAEIAHLAQEQLRTTGRIDPGAWEALRAIAETERGASWTPLAWTGLAIGAGAGGLYLWKRRKAQKDAFR
jgi:LPXTG-motif cell wall-anchored protein